MLKNLTWLNSKSSSSWIEPFVLCSNFLSLRAYHFRSPLRTCNSIVSWNKWRHNYSWCFLKSTRVLYLEQRNDNFSEKLHFFVLVFVVHRHLQHGMNVLDIATKDKHGSDTWELRLKRFESGVGLVRVRTKWKLCPIPGRASCIRCESEVER